MKCVKRRKAYTHTTNAVLQKKKNDNCIKYFLNLFIDCRLPLLVENKKKLYVFRPKCNPFRFSEYSRSPVYIRTDPIQKLCHKKYIVL